MVLCSPVDLEVCFVLCDILSFAKCVSDCVRIFCVMTVSLVTVMHRLLYIIFHGNDYQTTLY